MHFLGPNILRPELNDLTSLDFMLLTFCNMKCHNNVLSSTSESINHTFIPGGQGISGGEFR